MHQAPEIPPADSRPSLRRVRAFLARPVVRIGVLLIAVLVSVWNVDRVPDLALLPAVLGLLPFVVGKYVACPLRWHALSASGRSRRWHLRAYAESEVLGLMSPWHAGADLWRIHRLETAGVRRTPAVAEVALDRFVGAVGLVVAVLLTGVALPPAVAATALGGAGLVAAAAVVVGRRKPELLDRWPRPTPKVFALGIVLSIAYQLTIVGFLVGAIHAVGDSVSTVQLLAVFGASQIAGALPGIHGASPREGALVAGLAAIGVSWSAALGAVALTALLTWVPALLGGGTLLVARWVGGRRAVGEAGAGQ